MIPSLHLLVHFLLCPDSVLTGPRTKISDAKVKLPTLQVRGSLKNINHNNNKFPFAINDPVFK